MSKHDIKRQSFAGIMGKVLVAVVVISLVYFVFFHKSDSENSMPMGDSETEIVTAFEQIGIELGRYNVYLEENKFDEAKNSILNSKLMLSDIEVKSVSVSMTESERNDFNILIASYKDLYEGADLFIDFKKSDNNKNILTWDTYNQALNDYTKARNKYADFYNKAITIKDEDIKNTLNLSTYNELIDMMDEEIAVMQSENVTELVRVNTYISKINPLDTDVRRISASIEKEYGSEFDSRLAGIAMYFYENLRYIHIPNWNPDSNIQYIQEPDVTLAQEGGNCADLSILFSSMAESIGIPTQFCFADIQHTLAEIERNPDLFNSTHAVIQYQNEDNDWLTLDVTCYAGADDLSVGDECNTQVNTYIVQCYNVQEFKEAIKIN